MSGRFDLDEVKAQADLGRVIETYLQSPLKVSGRWSWWRCPFHAAGNEKTPSLGVTSDNGLWVCFGCGESGDVFEFVRRMEKRGNTGKDFVEVVKKVQSLVGLGIAMADTPVQTQRLPEDQRPPSARWQRAARGIVAAAQKRLWEDVGADARAYLIERRGLTEKTLRAWGLGFHANTTYAQPDAFGLDRDRDVWLPQGIVIPGDVAGVMWYVKFRPSKRVRFGGKYYGIPGGKTALLGADRWVLGRPLLLCEGEMDAFTAWQAVRDRANVATLGGASKGRRGTGLAFGRWMGSLMQHERILAAFDTDAAGQAAGEAMAGFSNRVEQVRVPYGEDLNGFASMGGDLRRWFDAVAGEGYRGQSASRWPLVMVLEDGPGLAVPNGAWRRRDDGKLEVTFASAAELEATLEATRAVRMYDRE